MTPILRIAAVVLARGRRRGRRRPTPAIDPATGARIPHHRRARRPAPARSQTGRCRRGPMSRCRSRLPAATPAARRRRSGCSEAIPDDDIRVTFTVPDGWEGTATLASGWPAGIGQSRRGGDHLRAGRLAVQRSVSERRHRADPGRADRRGLRRRARGASPARRDDARSTSALAGYSGKYLELQVPMTHIQDSSARSCEGCPSTAHGSPGTSPRGRVSGGTSGSSMSAASAWWSRPWTTRARHPRSRRSSRASWTRSPSNRPQRPLCRHRRVPGLERREPGAGLAGAGPRRARWGPRYRAACGRPYRCVKGTSDSPTCPGSTSGA